MTLRPRLDTVSDMASGPGPYRPSTARILLFAVPVAALAALGIAAQTYLSMLRHGHSFRAIFPFQLCGWLLWALAAPVLVRAGGALVAGGHRLPRVQARLAGLAAGLVAVHIALTAQLTVWFQPYVPFMPATYRQALASQAWAVLPMDALAVTLLAVIGWALAGHHRAQWLEVRESRLEADLARASLDALRLEIQPHFLFNALNTIAALIRRRSNDRALSMLVRLSDLMRDTLARTPDPLVSLETEVAFTRRYVELQQVRFADRIHVEWDTDPRCDAMPVPTFLLQPLVENAIRHGIGRRNQPGHLGIGAHLSPDGRLELRVTDDGVGLPPAFDLARDARTGLGNIRSRLEHLYGAKASLDVRPRDGGGVSVDIRLPVARPASLEVPA